MNYEQGLTMIEHSIKGTVWYTDFHSVVAHLRGNLEAEKRSGLNEALREARLSIIEQLDQLTMSCFGMNFADLCHEKQMQVVITPAAIEQTLLEKQTREITRDPARKIRNKVFISFNNNDRKYLNILHSHLEYYARTGAIDFWDGTKIPAGARWQKEIEHALTVTRIAVLMVSADFLASDYIAKKELPPLLKAEAEGSTLIYCVILRPCVFSHTELAKFEAINPPSHPLSTMSEAEQEAVWVKLANLIRENLHLERRPTAE